jgi:hypothetical protein
LLHSVTLPRPAITGWPDYAHRINPLPAAASNFAHRAGPRQSLCSNVYTLELASLQKKKQNVCPERFGEWYFP